jgi:hypothetical protein
MRSKGTFGGKVAPYKTFQTNRYALSQVDGAHPEKPLALNAVGMTSAIRLFRCWPEAKRATKRSKHWRVE